MGDTDGGPDDLVGIEFGPLIQRFVDRIVENADISTVVLLLVVFVLISLLISERSRNNALTKNYMAQSIELVAVLASVRELMNTNVRFLQVNETAVAALVEKMTTLILTSNLMLDRIMPKKRGASERSDDKGEPT